MRKQKVLSAKINDVLDNLRDRHWLVPEFQRDFVWGPGQVCDLIESIIDGRPIGMATIWEQPEEETLSLEPLSLEDVGGLVFFTNQENNPSERYAIIDGKQRCTALAVAFGGFRTTDGRKKHCGAYFLSVRKEDEFAPIKYFKSGDIARLQIDSDAGAISSGYFPLSSSRAQEDLYAQWLRYNNALRNPDFYEKGLPSKKELERRAVILEGALKGIIDTELAVYVIPSKYSLGEICEIFETLNTTGTRVSTVDLIHSQLYNVSLKTESEAFQLREWIDDLGEREGAIGWAQSSHRPELVAQFATGAYIAQDNPPKARRVGKKIPAISSVKAEDLLGTPYEFWKRFATNAKHIATYLGDFQHTVAGGFFSMRDCPYPVSAGIYLALRWHRLIDKPGWQVPELDALYRAFFWRNALSGRYDQGFLTQMGQDIRTFKQWLKSREEYQNVGKWAKHISTQLDKYMEKEVPSRDRLIEHLLDGSPGGALQKALMLPMIAQVQEDVFDPSIDISFPGGIENRSIHHIYPKRWCKGRASGKLKKVLNPSEAPMNYVNSIANSMPMAKKTNVEWSSDSPATFITANEVEYDPVAQRLNLVFIGEGEFKVLANGNKDDPLTFWEQRAQRIADYILTLTKVSV
ncbi:MAG: DUF262 domain-containing protein [Planctomycetes bacterium]|nr:DUF262 domain-containing protein [Planctomycetota bacterium]